MPERLSMTRFPPRLGWLLLAGACALAVLLSLALTDWFNQDACHLCIFQRFLFMVLSALALGSALVRVHLGARLFGPLAAATATTGLGVATYQSWLQLRARDDFGLGLCSAGEPGLIERWVDWLGMQLPALFTATGFCADEGASLLGLTIANWTAIAFAASLAAAAWLLWQSWRAPARR